MSIPAPQRNAAALGAPNVKCKSLRGGAGFTIAKFALCQLNVEFMPHDYVGGGVARGVHATGLGPAEHAMHIRKLPAPAQHAMHSRKLPTQSHEQDSSKGVAAASTEHMEEQEKPQHARMLTWMLTLLS